MLQADYPTREAVDAWCQALLAEADAQLAAVREITDSPVNSFPLGVRHHVAARHIGVTVTDGDTFYAYWQPSASAARAPLLIHLPGYGAEMTAHPELVALGYNVLHINPQGYATPYGYSEEKKVDGVWPVLPETVTSTARVATGHGCCRPSPPSAGRSCNPPCSRTAWRPSAPVRGAARRSYWAACSRGAG